MGDKEAQRVENGGPKGGRREGFLGGALRCPFIPLSPTRQLEGLGECCKLPKQGPGQSPGS